MAFVVPPGPGWPLPAYELALMTAHHAWDADRRPQITPITPEPAPLAVFGRAATASIRAELELAGIGFHGCSYADARSRGDAATVVVHPGMRRIDVDRVVALPRLLGRPPAGVPTVRRRGSWRSTPTARCTDCATCGPRGTASRSR